MTTVTVAQGARSQLLLKKQSALGTAATGNFRAMRLNTFNVNPNIDIVTPAEIRGDRHLTDQRHGNRSVRGQSVHELVYGAHDDLIEGAMFSTFSGVVTDNQGLISGVGVTPSYYSLEDGALDLAVYRQFYDMMVSRARFDFGTGQNAVAKLTIDWVGLSGGDPDGTSIGGTPVGTSNVRPFDTFSGALYDNSPETGVELVEVTALSIDINNNVRPTFGLGQQTGINTEFGRGLVTGNITMYYTQRSRQFIERFTREIDAFLVFTLSEPISGHTMEFRMPKIKINGGDIPLANEQSRIITMPYSALYDGSTYELLITKLT